MDPEQTTNPENELANPPVETATTPSAPVADAPGVDSKRSPLFFVGIAAVVLAVIGGGAYHYMSKEAAPVIDEALPGGLSEAEASEPVAYVNGATITRGTLQGNIDQMTQAAVQNGSDPADMVVKAQIETQAFDISVNNELLKQAAAKEAERPSEAAVQAEIDQLVEANGGQEAFNALLVEVGFTEETLRANIADSLHIQAYLTSKETPVTVTDADVQAFYDSLGGEGAGLPPLEEVREQVVAEIERQEKDAQVSALIETLRAEATIEKV